MFDWVRSWFTGKQHEAVDWKAIYTGPNDLPSLNEMIQKHVQMLDSQQEGKWIQTSDDKTKEAVSKMLVNDKFMQQHILGTPNNSTNQTQSLKVKICDINKHPTIKKSYNAWRQKGRHRIIAVGGPSAQDQTLFSSLIPAIKQTHDIHFYTRNYLQANLMHCAFQSLARHANALNADPLFSGRGLFPVILKRIIFGVSLNEVVQSDFIKVDVKLNNFAYMIEYVKNQFNGIKQLWLGWRGHFTQHDLNRFESVVSQDIQKVMERISKCSFTSRIQNNKLSQTMSINLIFNESKLKGMQEANRKYQKIQGIKINQISQAQLKEMFPQSKIVAAWRYIGDYCTKLNMYDLQRKKCQELGAVWHQNKTLSKVYVDKNESGPFACGIQFTDGEFVPADKIHLTLGYKAGYFYEGTNKRAVKNINIPVAGVSTNLLLEKTPNLKKILEEKGSLQVEITSSHWTVLGHDDKHVLLRATAGGNTGSQAYQPSHFLNLCRNTRSIFGDSFVGILSAYGCPRAVNYKNSTEFCQIAKGLVVSYGKGGTGNTKRAAQAYKALKYLGLGNQLQNFFGQMNGERVNIVTSMKKVLQKTEQTELFYDYSSQTKRNLFHQHL